MVHNGTWNYEHYAQIIERIGPIRQHQAGHPRPVFVYQIQAEGTLDQVVQARVEGKADVQDLLMEYCKMKSPSIEGLFYPRRIISLLALALVELTQYTTQLASRPDTCPAM